jgi:hypothetical protein
MANFVATVLLKDSFNRYTRKKVETETDVLATAQTAVSGFLTDLAAVIDLECVGVSYVLKDPTQVFAGAASSNVDVGATFRGRVASGEVVTLKVPGITLSFVGADGVIDVTDVSIAALLDNFEGAGEFTLSDGESISEWLSGSLDK